MSLLQCFYVQSVWDMTSLGEQCRCSIGVLLE